MMNDDQTNYIVTRKDDDAREHDLPLETNARKAVIAAELTPENRQVFTAWRSDVGRPEGPTNTKHQPGGTRDHLCPNRGRECSGDQQEDNTLTG
jgi:hypothetical protein